MHYTGRFPRYAIRFCLIVVCLLVASAPLFGETPLRSGTRIALVVGNAAYQEYGSLKNPRNDAEDMAKALSSLGFQVDLLCDAEAPALDAAVLRLKSALAADPASIGFFFYAGHAVQSGGINYLIPVDVRILSEEYLPHRSFALPVLLDSMTAAGNALNIVVLDACRDNPFSWSRGTSRGLSVVGVQPPSSIIAYATSAGSVARDGEVRNGIFTAELLPRLLLPGIDVAEVFRLTGQAVADKTRGAQLPAVYSQYYRRFYLAAEPEVAVATNDKTTIPPQAIQTQGKPADPVKPAEPAPSPTAAAQKGNGGRTGQGRTQEDTGILPPIPTSESSFQIELPQDLFYLLPDHAVPAQGVAWSWEGEADASKGFRLHSAPGQTSPALQQPSPAGSIIAMAPVAGGSFVQGSDLGDADEAPRHRVQVSSFLMGLYPVSVGEFAEVARRSGIRTTAELTGYGYRAEEKQVAKFTGLTWKAPGHAQGSQSPVTMVSWVDAVLFCNALSILEGLQPAYHRVRGIVVVDVSASGYRLPTEAEWEYAASGGSRARGSLYPGSNDLDEVGWYGGSGIAAPPAQRGQKKPNELGLYEMAGSVWEWCHDWYGVYSPTAAVDPSGPQSGSYHVIRGGSWKSDADSCATANRGAAAPLNRSDIIGFRVVRRP